MIALSIIYRCYLPYIHPTERRRAPNIHKETAPTRSVLILILAVISITHPIFKLHTICVCRGNPPVVALSAPHQCQLPHIHPTERGRAPNIHKETASTRSVLIQRSRGHPTVHTRAAPTAQRIIASLLKVNLFF